MTFEFILAEKAHYPVRILCAVLGVSPSGYYAWRGRPLIAPRVRANRVLAARIRAIHRASCERYGSPRVHHALHAQGERVGRNRVIRLMQREQLCGRPRRQFRVTTVTDSTATPAPNVLKQVFRATGPNRIWLADITAVATAEGWVYLAVVLDLWSRRIVGWAMRSTLASELVCAAWTTAVARRAVRPGLVHHSDRGTQYTSESYQRLLRVAGVRCSMSRRGNCWDNAPTESFFRTLKVELDGAPWPTRRSAIRAIAAFIERFYNTTRLHSSLGYRSPATFEARAAMRRRPPTGARPMRVSRPPSRPPQLRGPRRRPLAGACR